MSLPSSDPRRNSISLAATVHNTMLRSSYGTSSYASTLANRASFLDRNQDTLPVSPINNDASRKSGDSLVVSQPIFGLMRSPRIEDTALYSTTCGRWRALQTKYHEASELRDDGVIQMLREAARTFFDKKPQDFDQSNPVPQLLCMPYVVSRLTTITVNFLVACASANCTTTHGNTYCEILKEVFGMWAVMVDSIFANRFNDIKGLACLLISQLSAMLLPMALGAQNKDLMDACVDMLASVCEPQTLAKLFPTLRRSTKTCIDYTEECYAAVWGEKQLSTLRACMSQTSWGDALFRATTLCCVEVLQDKGNREMSHVLERLQSPLVHSDVSLSEDAVDLFLRAPWRAPLPFKVTSRSQCTLDGPIGFGPTVTQHDARRFSIKERAARSKELGENEGSLYMEDVDDARYRIASTYPDVADLPPKALPLCAHATLRSNVDGMPGDWKNEDRYMAARFVADVGVYDIEDLVTHFDTLLEGADPHKFNKRRGHIKDTLTRRDGVARKKAADGYAPLASHSCHHLIGMAEKRGKEAPRFACPFAKLRTNADRQEKGKVDRMLSETGINEKNKRDGIIETAIRDGPRLACMSQYREVTGSVQTPPAYPVFYTHKVTRNLNT